MFVPKSRTNLLANSFPLYCCWFVLNRSLNYFSSKKFSRVVVYCSVIKVLNLCCSFQATALTDYHIAFRLSTTFFICFNRLPGLLPLPSSGRSASASPVGMLREFFPVISDRCYLIISKSNCQRFFCFLFISDNSFNSTPSLTFSVLFLHPKQSIIYLGFYIETRHTDDMFSVL